MINERDLVECSEKYVRNFWRPQDGFPAPIGRRPALHTTGPDPELYDEAALDAWRARALTSPTPYPMPAAAGIGQQRRMEGPIVQAQPAGRLGDRAGE
ncbi:hypothetical protein [Nonomuraea dietziae]|uniref:hypothetical protein n=1 Tax=Nonomuraea dietziae TaxID=65515 RepID=UPI0033CF46CD